MKILNKISTVRIFNIRQLKILFNCFRYYLATSEHKTGQQHLYRLSLSTLNAQPKCLSCDILREPDSTRCLYNTAKFSTDNSYYVLTCAGPGVPEIFIYNRVSIIL